MKRQRSASIQGSIYQKLSQTLQQSLNFQQEMLSKVNTLSVVEPSQESCEKCRDVKGKVEELKGIFGEFYQEIHKDIIPFHSELLGIVQRITKLYGGKLQELEGQLQEQTQKRKQAQEDLKILKGLIAITIQKKEEDKCGQKININEYITQNQNQLLESTQPLPVYDEDSQQYCNCSSIKKTSWRKQSFSSQIEELNISKQFPKYSPAPNQNFLSESSNKNVYSSLKNSQHRKGNGWQNIASLNCSVTLKKQKKNDSSSFLKVRKSSKNKMGKQSSRLEQLRMNLLYKHSSHIF